MREKQEMKQIFYILRIFLPIILKEKVKLSYQVLNYSR